MASPNLDEMATTTLRNRSGKLRDNVTENNALLTRLRSKGNLKKLSGGRTIVHELEYAENSTYLRYSGYDQLNISPSDVFTAAEFNWKQAAVAVSISGLEELKNSGKEAIINLLGSRIKNAEKTFKNQLSADIYSDGTASNQINGLEALVAESPSTGTVGGINRATYTWWRNYSLDGSGATASTIQAKMNDVYLNICRGADKPDLIVADNNLYKLYLESLQSIQRIASDDVASAGFNSLKYMEADVVLDGGYNGSAPADSMYFLNTDYIHLCTHSKRDITVLNPDRFAVNQDAMVKILAWAGNLTIGNAFVQGKLYD